MPERARHLHWFWLCFFSVSCTSAIFDSEVAPFSQAEVDRALAPIPQLEQRCYRGSESERRKVTAHYDFIAYVDTHGKVHADPRGSDVHDPALLECLRTGIEQLSFPDKGAADQFRLRFELKR